MRKHLQILILTAFIFICFSRCTKNARDSDAYCLKIYDELYSGPELQITVAFGYKDTAPARFVGDRYEKSYFVQKILEPCALKSGDREDCGFSRKNDEDADLFTKSIPSPTGRSVLIKLRVVNSSISPDDKANRLDPLQKWQSDYAQTKFVDALRMADIVFYNGHSRDGGGPDFFPARMTRESHVDYAWYQKQKPGLRMIAENLVKPKLVGLFSCISNEHFSKTILETNKAVGLIGSEKLLYYTDALEGSLNTLDAILRMKCHPAFDQGGIQLIGFVKSQSAN